MSDGMEWLDAMVGVVRAAACGAAYRRADLRVIGQRDEHRSLRCVCAACGSEAVAVVSVHARHAPRSSVFSAGRPPITIDDVLIAHEILRDHTGNDDALFGVRPIT